MKSGYKKDFVRSIRHMAAAFLLGALVYYVGGFSWLAFYMLFVLSLLFATVKLSEERILRVFALLKRANIAVDADLAVSEKLHAKAGSDDNEDVL